jgi:hypothetical protein
MRRQAPVVALAVAVLSLLTAAAATARPVDNQLIEHQVQIQSNGFRTESWTDVSTGQRRSISTKDGRPTIENVFSSVDGKAHIDTVFYVTKTWITNIPGFPAGDGQTVTQYAQSYRDQVARGMYKIVGHDRIRGHETVQLERTLSMTMQPGLNTITTDLWVDTLTYLPVRQRSSMSASSSVQEIAYDWLPRTPENLVNLALVVPDGFRHQLQGPANCSTGGGSLTGSWLSIHQDNSPVICSGHITLGHS